MRRRGLLSPPQFVVRILRVLPLTKRGALFILCGLVLVFLVFGGFSVFSVRKSAERASDWTLRAAHVAAERLSHHIQHERDGVEHIARWPGIAESLDLLQSGRGGAPPPWVTLHYLASDEHDFGDCVFVTDRNGIVLWTKPPGLGLLNADLSSYPEIREAFRQDDTSASSVIRDGFWPEPHILVATKIRNAEQEVVGLVGNVIGAGRLKNGELFNELKGLTEEVGQRVTYVVDEEGTIVTALDPSRVFERTDDEALLSWVRQRKAAFTVSGDGKVQAVHPLSPVHWSVVLEQSAGDFYKDIYQLERNLVAVGLLLTVLALVVWVPFVESFVRPIRTLTAEAERIASGDLSHAIPRDGRDEITALSTSLDNMREQLEEDQRRLQAQIVELDEMNRLKSEFIANLSHEFRTPMHVMRGYIDLLMDGVFGALPAHFHEPLAAVSRQYDALWEIVESCLRLAKIDAGKEQAAIESFDLTELIREVMNEFALLFREHGLGTSVRVPSTCQVKSDRTKIQHILRNLVGNAVKFTEHGEVEVSAQEGPDPGAVTLRVRDTGIGISTDDQKIIFDRFRQADGSPTRRFDGAGLGLSIASELTRLLGGTLSVISTLGQGSTFSVILPRVLLAPEGTAHPLHVDKRADPYRETTSAASRS